MAFHVFGDIQIAQHVLFIKMNKAHKAHTHDIYRVNQTSAIYRYDQREVAALPKKETKTIAGTVTHNRFERREEMLLNLKACLFMHRNHIHRTDD